MQLAAGAHQVGHPHQGGPRRTDGQEVQDHESQPDDHAQRDGHDSPARARALALPAAARREPQRVRRPR